MSTDPMTNPELDSHLNGDAGVSQVGDERLAERLSDAEIFAWLEEQAKNSRTGISFDWVPACEGDPSGWRFMRRHFISEPHKSLRQAIASAIDFNLGRAFK